LRAKFSLFIILAILFSFSGKLQAATLFQEVGISSSPNPVGSGARAVGMGGAFMAVADDATAASWNPAGLIQLEKPELSIVGAYFNREDEFSSDTNPGINNTGKTDDFNLNYFSAAYPFQLFKRNIVASINYQRLYEFERKFSFNNSSFSQDGFLGALGLASAIQITPGLSLGATFNIWTDKLFWENAWEEHFSDGDTTITDSYTSFNGFNANFGLLWDINEYLTVGTVVKTPFEATLRHDYNFNNISSATQLSIREDVTLRMPMSYGLGLALRLSDALSFALDIYRTDWSEYILTDDGGTDLSPIDGRLKGDSDVKDTTQIRVGGEYLFIGKETVIPVRAGVFYDPEPSSGSPEDFYGFSVGSGVGYKKFIFDMAYQLRWGHNVDTNNLIATSTADITQHLLLASLIVHF
jgi:long-subunit fatty acid transport protein